MVTAIPKAHPLLMMSKIQSNATTQRAIKMQNKQLMSPLVFRQGVLVGLKEVALQRDQFRPPLPHQDDIIQITTTPMAMRLIMNRQPPLQVDEKCKVPQWYTTNQVGHFFCENES